MTHVRWTLKINVKLDRSYYDDRNPIVVAPQQFLPFGDLGCLDLVEAVLLTQLLDLRRAEAFKLFHVRHWVKSLNAQLSACTLVRIVLTSS